MPRQNLTSSTLPAAVAQAIRVLGANISIARKRRGLRQVDLARKTGLAPLTLQRIEQGVPTTSVGAYFAVLWALGLETEISNVAPPERDEEGKALERARSPKRVRPKEDLDADF